MNKLHLYRAQIFIEIHRGGEFPIAHAKSRIAKDQDAVLRRSTKYRKFRIFKYLNSVLILYPLQDTSEYES